MQSLDLDNFLKQDDDLSHSTKEQVYPIVEPEIQQKFKNSPIKLNYMSPTTSQVNRDT